GWRLRRRPAPWWRCGSAPVRDGADLPDWLPPLVAERARTILTAAAEAGSEPAIVSAIKRLTADPRMEGVWKYLQRKKRERSQRTQAYEYPVKDIVDGTWEPSRTFPAAFPTRAVYMQNLAMEVFYCHVLCTMTGGRINGFGGPWPTPTPTDEFVSQWCNF